MGLAILGMSLGHLAGLMEQDISYLRTFYSFMPLVRWRAAACRKVKASIASDLRYPSSFTYVRLSTPKP